MPRETTIEGAALLADLRRRAKDDPAAAWLLRLLERGERAGGPAAGQAAETVDREKAG